MAERKKSSTPPDRRIARTRKALTDAFVSLFFELRYDRIKVGDIVSRAGVSRSTFYEHFADKDAILAETLRGPFTLMTSMLGPKPDDEGLPRLLSHFWSHQDQARHLFGGGARRAVTRVLAAMFEEELRARAGQVDRGLAIDVVAIALAEATLGAITAWLTGRTRCDAATLATTLRAFFRASWSTFTIDPCR